MKPTTPKHRALTAREKFVLREYTRVQSVHQHPEPKGYAVFLQINYSEFRINDPVSTKEEADGLQDVFVMALSRIVK